MNKPLLFLGGIAAGVGAYLIWSRLKYGPKSQTWPNWIAPVRGPVTGEGWGDDRSSRGEGAWHEGIDLYVPVGTPVRAVADGVVEFVDKVNNSFAGIWVIVNHGDGLKSRYLHLSSTSKMIGDKVRQGEVIGKSGRTGISDSTEAHLHFDVRADERALAIYFERFGRPTPDFVYHSTAGEGWAVPAEPLVPAVYGPRAVASANNHNVKVWVA